MFRPWVVAVGLVTLVVTGMLWSAVKTWLPPPPSSYGTHSYSGRTVGYRGLYETLEELGVPVRRSWDTPDELFRGERRVLLLQPRLELVEREKAYLAVLERWLEAGGELVVVTRHLEFLEEEFKDADGFDDEEERRNRRRKMEEILGKDRFPSVLGVEGLRIASAYDLYGMKKTLETFDGPISLAVEPDWEYAASFDGTLASLEGSVESLALPDEELRWFEGEAVERAVGKVEIGETEEDRAPIALEFRRGQGRVTLIAEPTLLNNIGLGKSDNAVLACRLIAGDGNREVVFDEYYHGALAELGPSALLVRHPYGTMAAFVLVASLLWAWANAVRFGPPVPATEAPRRSILEYVDAMSRLFHRGRKTVFVLRVNREGLLDELRRELRLPHGTPQSEIVRRLSRAEPERARRLEEVLREVDRALAAEGPPSEHDLTTLQERLETCRSRKAPKHSLARPRPPMAS